MCSLPASDMHSHSDLSLPTERAISYRKDHDRSCRQLRLVFAPVKEETRKACSADFSYLIDGPTGEAMNWSWHSSANGWTRSTLWSRRQHSADGRTEPLESHVVGTEKRDPAAGELPAMRAILNEAMEQGAWGMSTGRSHRPGARGHPEIISLVGSSRGTRAYTDS